MNAIENRLRRVLEALLAGLFLVILLLVVIQVALRYLFNESIAGANEFLVILFVYTTAIGGALAAGRDEHISLTFAVDQLSPNRQRLQARLSLLAVAFINGVMVYHSIHWIGVTGSYLMPSTGLPRIVAQFSIPLGCGLATLYCGFRAFTLSVPEASNKEVSSPS